MHKDYAVYTGHFSATTINSSFGISKYTYDSKWKGADQALGGGGNAFIGHLWCAPNATVPEHRDESEEYLFILDGHGQIFIDGVSYEIKKGHLIYMQSGARVQYINGNQPLKALQIFAGPESASKYNSWKEMQQPPQSEPLSSGLFCPKCMNSDGAHQE